MAAEVIPAASLPVSTTAQQAPSSALRRVPHLGHSSLGCCCLLGSRLLGSGLLGTLCDHGCDVSCCLRTETEAESWGWRTGEL